MPAPRDARSDELRSRMDSRRRRPLDGAPPPGRPGVRRDRGPRRRARGACRARGARRGSGREPVPAHTRRASAASAPRGAQPPDDNTENAMDPSAHRHATDALSERDREPLGRLIARVLGRTHLEAEARYAADEPRALIGDATEDDSKGPT